jgi:hypothetical protein
MSRKETERAEKAERDRAEKDRKDKDKSDRKIQVDERARKFEDVLGAATEGCCESCNYQVRTSNGEYQPCKRGHKDSGPDKEFCVDSSNPLYCPKK